VTQDNQIKIAYEATCDQDTVLNLTNHSYFNLGGHDSGTILDHLVWIDSEEYTYADAESIPNGTIRSVDMTPMDFRMEKAIGKEIDSDYDQLVWGKGYDHNWILKTQNGKFDMVAKLIHEKSGRIMETWTDLPGMQFYTGNFLDGTEIGKGGVSYGRRSGVCFETQYYPNAINVPEFPQPVLKAGEVFKSTTVYKFLTKK
jgi:aldose 1-epimerase